MHQAKKLHLDTLKSLFGIHKETHLFHRYIHTETIKPVLNKLSSGFKVEPVGRSVNGEDIFSITLGTGSKKVLMWSQMHGNESTTTKALFDLLNTLSASNAYATSIIENCTIKIIPILNPDGALVYTRLNANEVDLNRDAQNLSQPESRVLRQVFNAFNPDYCFNLHGQRTIYNVGNNPATVSFLSPAQDEACSITKSRKVAMEIIGKMNVMLQSEIPNQVGIYDDTFNINCVGDTFQSENVPTILFEAGHYKNDYAREKTREFIYQSLLTAMDYISNHTINGSQYAPYLEIPKNESRFYDIIIRNVRIVSKGAVTIVDIGILYEEQLKGNKVEFSPIIEKIADLDSFLGHNELDALNQLVLSPNSKALNEGHENDFVLINDKKFSLKPEKY
jgi:hypothetical protein